MIRLRASGKNDYAAASTKDAGGIHKLFIQKRPPKRQMDADAKPT